MGHLGYSYRSSQFSNLKHEILFKWNVLNMIFILIALHFQPCIIHWAKEITLMRNNRNHQKQPKIGKIACVASETISVAYPQRVGPLGWLITIVTVCDILYIVYDL